MKIKSAAITIAALGMVACLTGCDDVNTATRALESAGLEPVQVGGYGWFSCSEDDSFATKFLAKNAKGKMVTGVVCSTWMTKGATIRYD